MFQQNAAPQPSLPSEFSCRHNALQNYKIFWNKIALQPKICKKEVIYLEDKRKMSIFAASE